MLKIKKKSLNRTLNKIKVKIHKFKQQPEKIGEIQTIKTLVLNYKP